MDLDIPSHILSDLCSRFVINMDDRHKEPMRALYMTEQAHWHYLDFYCNEMPNLPKCKHKFFSQIIFAYLPDLNQFLNSFEELYKEWLTSKRQTPSYGAILLSPDYKYVLILQGFGRSASWGFPKGRIEFMETEMQCAIREVQEETKLDISGVIQEDVWLENRNQGHHTRLYLIPGIPTTSPLGAELRKEIKDYKWFSVDALPSSKDDCVVTSDEETFNLSRIFPFVRGLRQWIEEQQKKRRLMPASQFTAKGRSRRRGSEGQHRKASSLGPQGDAPAPREGQGQGRSSRAGQVARNLNSQFSDVATSQSVQQSRTFLATSRGGSTPGGKGRRDQNQTADNTQGRSRTRGGDKSANLAQLRPDAFYSKAMLNFKFDREAILDCLKW